MYKNIRPVSGLMVCILEMPDSSSTAKQTCFKSSFAVVEQISPITVAGAAQDLRAGN